MSKRFSKMTFETRTLRISPKTNSTLEYPSFWKLKNFALRFPKVTHLYLELKKDEWGEKMFILCSLLREVKIGELNSFYELRMILEVLDLNKITFMLNPELKSDAYILRKDLNESIYWKRVPSRKGIYIIERRFSN